ncbi:MAG: prephenate dehydrogenase/arogenate dehydrogenase family protein [Candidatus Eisenbacteria bacterium]|uniref:Prephenate dehydrogenase/arogenate dehydrogenase family protein n=1 Tax=Eiseniibacteriota bacterium TaxID=2212470 RepID=A0A7Y2E705_UNCEI|nr:prephenate dehydrogenase/arogenate dehydrogenase family protein [Candidatus Eisenbacteria bacterium]
MSSIRKVGVLGLGLVGASLAGALRRAGIEVVGWDPDSDAIRSLRRKRWLSKTALDPDRIEGDFQVLVLAGPLSVNESYLRLLAPRRFSFTVTDVGSVKTPIAKLGKKLLGSSFVPGHPMAGGTGSGFSFATKNLFEDRPWSICGGGEKQQRQVKKLIKAVGAHWVSMTPEGHDRTVAQVSHLPQVLASILVSQTSKSKEPALELTGPGFADWARLAGSNPELWTEILDANKTSVVKEIKKLEKALARLRTEWEPQSTLKKGKEGYERWQNTSKPRP